MSGQSNEMSTPISQLGNAPPTQNSPIMPGGSGGATLSTVPSQMPTQMQNQSPMQPSPQPVSQQQPATQQFVQPMVQSQWNSPIPMNMNPYGLSGGGQVQNISNPSKINISNNAWDALSILVLFVCLNTNGAYKMSNNVLPTISLTDKTPTVTGVIIHASIAACIYFVIKKFI